MDFIVFLNIRDGGICNLVSSSSFWMLWVWMHNIARLASICRLHRHENSRSRAKNKACICRGGVHLVLKSF